MALVPKQGFASCGIASCHGTVGTCHFTAVISAVFRLYDGGGGEKRRWAVSFLFTATACGVDGVDVGLVWTGQGR